MSVHGGGGGGGGEDPMDTPSTEHHGHAQSQSIIKKIHDRLSLNKILSQADFVCQKMDCYARPLSNY